MRVSLAAPLESRDGTLSKDSFVKNGVFSNRGEGVPARLKKRPGATAYGTATSQLALLYATSRSYTTDVTAAVAIGDQSYATKYAISLDEGESSGVAGDYYTWGGSSWSRVGSLVSTTTLGSPFAFGCAQLDGYFFFMLANGKIYNSPINDPTTWATTDFVTLANDGGTAKAVTRYRNFIIGFTTATLQPFYDAGNPTGSVLSPVQSGIISVGCVKGRTIAHTKESMFWLGREAQLGPGVYMMTGFDVQRISNPAVDRIIAADSLATLYGTTLKAAGHDYYVLTLVESNLSLVYDINERHWGVWTYQNSGSSKSVSSITRSGTTATVVTSASHTLSDGDPVLMAGADQSEYNGIFQIQYVNATTFTIEVSGSPASPATGTITATPYSSIYYPFVRYVGVEGSGAMLSTTGTTWAKFSDTIYTDSGQPIDFNARTQSLDFGSSDRKTNPRISLPGDLVSSTGMIRWFDDDYTTPSSYRIIDLSDERPNVRRCGPFVKRAYEFRHVANTGCTIDSLELEIAK